MKLCQRRRIVCGEDVNKLSLGSIRSTHPILLNISARIYQSRSRSDGWTFMQWIYVIRSGLWLRHLSSILASDWSILTDCRDITQSQALLHNSDCVICHLSSVKERIKLRKKSNILGIICSLTNPFSTSFIP